jgi:hypothetical protein
MQCSFTLMSSGAAGTNWIVAALRVEVGELSVTVYCTLSQKPHDLPTKTEEHLHSQSVCARLPSRRRSRRRLVVLGIYHQTPARTFALAFGAQVRLIAQSQVHHATLTR